MTSSPRVTRLSDEKLAPLAREGNVAWLAAHLDRHGARPNVVTVGVFGKLPGREDGVHDASWSRLGEVRLEIVDTPVVEALQRRVGEHEDGQANHLGYPRFVRWALTYRSLPFSNPA